MQHRTSEPCLLTGFESTWRAACLRVRASGTHLPSLGATLVAQAADLQLRQAQCQQSLTAEQQELQAWTDIKSLHIESVSATIAKLKGPAAVKTMPDGLTAA